LKKHSERFRGAKEGIIWRIGDGTNVKIWEDPWVPPGDTRRPTTYKDGCKLTMVSGLIGPSTYTWNMQLLMQNFLPIDVSNILSIPLREDSKDFVAWH
jgi:hypothetical protein